MKFQMQWSPYWTVLALILYCTHGRGFLLGKGSNDDDFVDGDRVSHLKRRYWNDDIQICVEKFCQKYVGSSLYAKCLGYYCPGSLVAVPRDLDAMSIFPMAFLIGDDEEMCSENPTPFMNERHRRCIGSQCGSPPHDSMASSRLEISSQNVGDGRLTVLRRTLFDACRTRLCAGYNGDDAVNCAREKCCASKPKPREEKRDNDIVSRARERLTSLGRKRRVNDDVVQCIQSYCSGQFDSRRVQCIINNCQRI